MPMASINPATGETLETFAAHTDAEVDARLQRAAAAFRDYRRTPFDSRAAWLSRAAEILEAEKERFGQMMTLEMGKTLASAVQEVEKSARGCRYYAENGMRFLADERIEIEGADSFVRYDPIGAVLAVMPWNFPFWQVFRFAAPALMAGNVGLLKHASNVPQCSMAIEEILNRAGFPAGAFQSLLIPVDRVGPLIADPRVAAVTLTGSEAAGRQVAAAAGSHIKKSVLELGGSDPFIVTASANIEKAAAMAVTARCINNGQSCIAAKRFIVLEPIAAEITERFTAGMQALRVGDPMEAVTQLGPLATEAILAELDDQVRRLVEAGGELLTGGKRLPGPGFFYAPTVVLNPQRSADISREELFGPVACVYTVRSIEEAIELANDSPFGLGASVWTNDAEEQRRFTAEIDTGMVFVNAMVASDPRVPFGGVRRSGYGRELGRHGILEFVNAKTVWIARA